MKSSKFYFRDCFYISVRVDQEAQTGPSTNRHQDCSMSEGLGNFFLLPKEYRAGLVNPYMHKNIFFKASIQLYLVLSYPPSFGVCNWKTTLKSILCKEPWPNLDYFKVTLLILDHYMRKLQLKRPRQVILAKF